MADRIIPSKFKLCSCGASIEFKTAPPTYCVACRNVRKTERSRIGMAKQRRKRGIQQVKGALCNCANCGDLFTKNERKTVRCRSCAYANMIRLTLLQNAKRSSRIRQAIPGWADLSAIENMYKAAKVMEQLTGEKWHVDHYYPLRGKRVCGLHVVENLRVIQASVNLKKHNSHPEN